jgi:hypothetical protein
LFLDPREHGEMFVKGSIASITEKKRGSPFYRKERDEKKAQVLVSSLQIEPQTTARGTGSGLLVQNDRPGLNSSDDEEHLFSYSTGYMVKNADILLT